MQFPIGGCAPCAALWIVL